MSKIDTSNSMKSLQRIGFFSVLLVIGGMVVWATMTKLSGAVIASAVIVADTYSKKIQHREGGIIKEIKVRDGSIVKEGQPLIVLDSSDAKSEVAILTTLLDEALAKKARLDAQREGAEKVTFPSEFNTRSSEPELNDIIAGQTKLFDARRQAISSKKSQFEQQIAQLQQQDSGFIAQIQSIDKQLKFIETELVGLRDLKEKGLVPLSRVSTLEREAARLSGTRGELVANQAAAAAHVAEVKMQILQLDDENMTQTLTELRDVEARVAELKERLVAASLKLERSVIAAPSDGVVYQSMVHTVGGVVAPGETLMLIVPEKDDLVLQAQIKPEDIDQIYVGQQAKVKFPAFNARLTPDITAEVSQVSADTSRIDASTPPFYAIRLTLTTDELAKLGNNHLKPGMPAEAFIQTQETTPFRYIFKPITDQFSRALREG